MRWLLLHGQNQCVLGNGGLLERGAGAFRKLLSQRERSMGCMRGLELVARTERAV
jgi:hypothetical protein